MWNPNLVKSRDEDAEEDDSWEVKAFAEDTSNVMGTTWPPRSYTCTFCKREFRSAQALGGHMNVHRRDRARLHQAQLPASLNISSTTSINPTRLLIPTQELVANGGLCLLYSLPTKPNSNFNPSSLNTIKVAPHSLNSDFSYTEEEAASNSKKCSINNNDKKRKKIDSSTAVESGSIDLELRLGYT